MAAYGVYSQSYAKYRRSCISFTDHTHFLEAASGLANLVLLTERESNKFFAHVCALG